MIRLSGAGPEDDVLVVVPVLVLVVCVVAWVAAGRFSPTSCARACS